MQETFCKEHFIEEISHPLFPGCLLDFNQSSNLSLSLKYFGHVVLCVLWDAPTSCF